MSSSKASSFASPVDGGGYTSVKELQQWLSRFGECNRDHWRKGQVKKMHKSHDAEQDRFASSTSVTAKSLSVPYELNHRQERPDPTSVSSSCDKDRPDDDPNSVVSSSSSHSTSVASPPQPMRTVDGSVFAPKRETQTKRSMIPAVRPHQQPRPTTSLVDEAIVSSSPMPDEVLLANKADDEIDWHVSVNNEYERVRVIARSSTGVRHSTAPPPPPELNVPTAHHVIPTNDDDDEVKPYPDDDPDASNEVDDILEISTTLSRAMRQKVPLLFCKSRRVDSALVTETKTLTRAKTIMVPTTSKLSTTGGGYRSMGPSADDVSSSRSQTEIDFTEDIDIGSYFQFDDYWNIDPKRDSTSKGVRQTSPALMKEVSTSLVDVFEKEAGALGTSGRKSPWSEVESSILDEGADPDTTGIECALSSGSVADSSNVKSGGSSHQTDSSSISSKLSSVQLKVMTPPRNDITATIQRFGGRSRPRPPTSVQARMVALEKKWAESKQEQPGKKAVKWEALNGAYKKRIFLETKGLQ